MAIKTIIYNCTENDAIIRISLNEEGTEIDELEFKAHPMETGWTVIGYKDLRAAMRKILEHD